MLHWLAGQKPIDGSGDQDATGNVEPPETPAPVFAVRAFKHAIFGTPQTTQSKQRRHSNTESARPGKVEAKPVRPGMNRPKSSSDAQVLVRQDYITGDETLNSPTKGILLSPGTATARKKNVTFGETVKDNEEKRPVKSGLPEDYPGKFPSPWNADPGDVRRADFDVLADDGKPRTKLAEALEQARVDSKSRKTTAVKRKKDDDSESEARAGLSEPQSQSGRYWKHEYDIYRTNTQREVRKLIAKQKAAKSFAQMKDMQCTELAAQLKEEQTRVETLEARTVELAQLVQDLQRDLRASQEAENSRRSEMSRPKRQGGQRETAAGGGGSESVGQCAAPAVLKHPRREAGPIQRPSVPYNASAVSQDSEESTRKSRTTAAAPSKPDEAQIVASDDIWAQSFQSSGTMASVAAPRASMAFARRSKAGNEADANPLQILDLNRLSNLKHGKRNSSPKSTDVGCDSVPDLEGVDSKAAPYAIQARRDSALQSPKMTIAVPAQLENNSSVDPPAHCQPGEPRPGRGYHLSSESMSNSSQIRGPAASRDAAAVRTKTTTHAPSVLSTSNTKENIAPAGSQLEASAKPSAVWSSTNSAQAGTRQTSMTGKDGREVTSDRIEAARARIAARGRIP